MEYPFWVNDFDRIKNYRDSYPLASEIFEQPQSFGMEIIQRNQRNIWRRVSEGYLTEHIHIFQS